MDDKTAGLLVNVILVPVVKNLAGRRGVHGVTKDNLKTFTKDPAKVLSLLKENTDLHKKVIEDLADALDNIASEAVNALVAVFRAYTPGGSGGAGSDDD